MNDIITADDLMIQQKMYQGHGEKFIDLFKIKKTIKNLDGNDALLIVLIDDLDGPFIDKTTSTSSLEQALLLANQQFRQFNLTQNCHHQPSITKYTYFIHEFDASTETYTFHLITPFDK